MQFEGKVFVVTGGASGIGRGLAIRLMARGASVAIADVDEAGLAETAEIARQGCLTNARVKTWKLDVSRLEEWQAFRDEVIAEFGSVDGIINNAGVAMGASATEMTYEELDWMMRINFNGMVYGTREFLPHLMQRPEAVIANVSSVFGLFGVPTQAAYNASKFAIRGYTEALAQDLIDTNVHIASIHPGHIGTNIVSNARIAESQQQDGGPAADREAFAKSFREDGLAPEQAADVILDGISRKRRKILVGRDAKVMDFLARLAPTWFADRLGNRMRKAQVTNKLTS